ncbi:MAG: hypothetical protein A2161_13215 [Candidatus Schekmanbacteria bacterium RBG_13_48_7]|uniref:HTH arsR-type domain-containing protein n=1 Tax=Candidatus Schekmanbacteria bacterium RBG_13_48_7 TaxID=1817878 RepID=A0A1F7RPP7_9BACT|nr:MAG: hypothetical protein A2161_13215 [Candidatus Schekmanbacteria bacterium RBG_13_48_7]
MEEFLNITRALSDRNRVRALLALKDRELCVCQIIELLALAPSTVSKHMSILKQAHLVEGRKEGRWMYYRLPEGERYPGIKAIITWVFNYLSKDSVNKKDIKKLGEILKQDPEVLCKKQNKTCVTDSEKSLIKC